MPGAREEAQQGFPHVVDIALPQLHASRQRGASETAARLDALMAIMTSLSDTCVLNRAGLDGLHAMQHGAKAVLMAGGSAHPAGQQTLQRLDRTMLAAMPRPAVPPTCWPRRCFSIASARRPRHYTIKET